MNSYERFMAALRLEEPDRVPIMELEVEESVRQRILPGASLLNFYEQIDLDAIVVFEDIPWQEVNGEVKRDHFGMLRRFMQFDGPTWPFPVEPLVKEGQDLEEFLEHLQMPDPHNPGRLATLQAAVQRFKGRKAVIFGMHSSFIYPSFIRGIENLLMDYIINPEFARRLTQRVVDYFVELERRAIEAGADAIIECEDYCSNTGPFMSIDHFRKFVLPGLKRAGEVAHKYGVPFLKHADGNMWPLLDILVKEVGIEGYHPIEPAAGMDIGKVKNCFGARMAMIGNVDCSRLLTFGSPEEVKEATRECIERISPGGGHILSSSNVIHTGVPPQNFLALLEAAREFGRYPIH